MVVLVRPRLLERRDDPMRFELRVGEGDGKPLLPGEVRDLPAEFFRSLHNKRARPEPLGRKGQSEERRAVGDLTDAHQARLVRHSAAVFELINHPPVAPDRRTEMAADADGGEQEVDLVLLDQAAQLLDSLGRGSGGVVG